jgi:hypothetical protein
MRGSIPQFAAALLGAAFGWSALVWAAPTGEARKPGDLLKPPVAPPVASPTAAERVELTQLQATGSVDLATGKMQRNLLIQGKLVVADVTKVVGVTPQIVVTKLTDDKGRDLLKDLPERRGGAMAGRNFMSTAWVRQRGRDLPIHVNAWVNGLKSMPPSLGQIKGHVFALVSVRGGPVEIQPVRPGGLVEIAHGLSIQILRTKQEGAILSVEFSFDSDLTNPFFVASPQTPFVSGVALVDDQGHAATSNGWSTQRRRPAGDGKGPGGEGLLRFTLAPERQPKLLRIDVVTAVEERRIEFQASDLPSPLKADD